MQVKHVQRVGQTIAERKMREQRGDMFVTLRRGKPQMAAAVL